VFIGANIALSQTNCQPISALDVDQRATVIAN